MPGREVLNEPAGRGPLTVLRGSGVRTALRRAVWWAQDYVYVVVRQVAGFLHRGGPDAFLTPERPREPTIVLIPGVYEPWQFMHPLASLLHGHGHPVHVVAALGYNSGTIPEAARLVAEHIADRGLTDVVVVAHSKGGLIGKYAMLRHDPDHLIRSMVAINTPFGGSPYARWIPLAAVRAFVPTDATLAALTAELVVNSRITSVSGPFDPHIPGGSDLDGATNVHLATPGHFRLLSDPELAATILAAIEAAPAR